MLHIKSRSPFHLDLTVWAIGRQSHNKIGGEYYTRILVMGYLQFKVEVTREDRGDGSHLSVLVSGRKHVLDKVKREASVLLIKILGADEDLRKFYQLADKDGILSPLVSRFVGLKPPRFPTRFEALINAFAFQQLSLSVGITLLNRLSKTYGVSFGDDIGSPHAFPLRRRKVANAQVEIVPRARVFSFLIEKLRAKGFCSHGPILKTAVAMERRRYSS